MSGRVGLCLLLTVGLGGTLAHGQSGRGADAPIGATANPFGNPYLNPFLNPYATMQPMDRNALLLYYLKARDTTGAVGSGQMSGSRPGPGPTSSSTAIEKRRVAEMPRSSMTPGAGASRYFRRGPEPLAARNAHFGRQNHYFGNNGH